MSNLSTTASDTGGLTDEFFAKARTAGIETRNGIDAAQKRAAYAQAERDKQEREAKEKIQAVYESSGLNTLIKAMQRLPEQFAVVQQPFSAGDKDGRFDQTDYTWIYSKKSAQPRQSIVTISINESGKINVTRFDQVVSSTRNPHGGGYRTKYKETSFDNQAAAMNDVASAIGSIVPESAVEALQQKVAEIKRNPNAAEEQPSQPVQKETKPRKGFKNLFHRNG